MFQGAKGRCTPLVKARLGISHFEDHPIRVSTSYLLRHVFQNPELSGQIVKWAIELREFDIEYVPWRVIKV